MSMNREINFFLSVKVKQIAQGIFIHQQKYTTELLNKFAMDNCLSAKFRMAFGYKILVEPTRDSIDHKIYQGVIVLLMYLTASRPDIVFAIGLFGRY